MGELILVFLFSFFLTIIFSPLVFKLIKKIKARQTILHHVKEHESKQGTPTMGGIMFIFPIIFTSMLFFKQDYMYAIMAVVVLLAYGILGFLDDFIKIHYKQNLGLRAYQKIIGQLGISLIIAIFVYNNLGGAINIPFSSYQINIGLWIIPLIVLTYVATVNSVNLIDGMDGLCASTSISYFIAFGALIVLGINGLSGAGYFEQYNLLIVCVSTIGALFAFLFFNVFPAKIFMGDTGSLAIGGAVASVAILSNNILYLPLFGFVYVVTAVSDIIQVAYYKKTKKRVFKMAPLHHHFQMSGFHENKIVFAYFVISFILNSIFFALSILS